MLRMKREPTLVLALCAWAAVRVFVFSAAFPIFNNVDELAHFDLVGKYARGDVPRGMEPLDAATARVKLLYASPEYLSKPESESGEPLEPPLWTRHIEADDYRLEPYINHETAIINHESTQPPLYYAVAGLWYRFGMTAGLSGGKAAYWIRFLNALLAVPLVWAGYSLARLFDPGGEFLRLGVPLLIAFFPADAFYSISNDALLPLVTGAAFVCLVMIDRGLRGGYFFSIVTGLLVAAATLVKLSSIAIVAVALLVVTLRIFGAVDASDRKKAVNGALVLLAAATVPIVAWGVRNVAVLGDWTGNAAKVEFLGWSLKPLRAIFDHPLFTPAGMLLFWHRVIMTFWRGEFVWHMQMVGSAGWDRFYSISSFAFLLAAAVAPYTWLRSVPPERRRLLWLSLIMTALSIGFLASISIMYDFDSCPYPSRGSPYLTSGRLALGALIPFVLVYLSGLEMLLPGRRLAPARWGVLLAIVVLMTLSEISVSLVAFRSPYNWFHLR